MKGCEDIGSWAGRPRAQTMMKSDEVEAMLRLHALGWGLKRIAREFGCSRNTVRRYVAADGWMTYRRRAGGGRLERQKAWLQERFFQHRSNAEVVRQDLLREQSVAVSLRTVERAVAPFRRLLTAEAKATVRFETPPGRQLPTSGCGRICSWRRWGIRDAATWRRSGTSGSRRGSAVWKARSVTSAACPGRC